jgi:tellurium resistance protein TerD
MGFNLSKGERFSLTKAAPTLTKVQIGLGWDPNEQPNGPDFDLDVSAFMIGSRLKIPTDGYFVFYGAVNQAVDEQGNIRPVSEDGALMGSVDDRSGNESDGGDDEVMDLDLSKVNPQVEQIIICASICKFPHDSKKDRRTLDLNFGKVDDCYIRIVNQDTDEEIAIYRLSADFQSEDAVEFGRLFRIGNTWEFEAMGRGHQGSLPALIEMYT